jgi:phage protein D
VFSADRPPVVFVGGYDVGHRLARQRRSRSFVKMKDSAIAGQIAREAGLRSDATDTQVTFEYVAQANQTDWAFLTERAGRIGYELFVRDKVLHFRRPAFDGDAGRTFSLDSDVTEFRPRMSAVGQVGDVTVRGWDVKKKREVVGQANAPSRMGGTALGAKAADTAFGRSMGVRVNLGPGSQAEADQIARGTYGGGALGFVSGMLECPGQPQVLAGTVVRVDGAGTRFSGPYYVAAVAHTLDSEGYRTSLTVERNAT